MTRHSTPSQPAHLTRPVWPPLAPIKAFRLSRPLGEADWTQNHLPLPQTPTIGALTSFLGLPLGPDPAPSALHTESAQNTPLPATDEETEAQGGLLTVCWRAGFQSPVALPLRGPAFLSPPGLVLLDSLTKTSHGHRKTWICGSGAARKMKGEDFLWLGIR